MPKPTAAPTDDPDAGLDPPDHAASWPSSSSPWCARRSPSVADGDRRDEGVQALVAADEQVAADARGDQHDGRRRTISSTRAAADLAEQRVADDTKSTSEHRDVEHALGHQRADDRALATCRARGAISTTRIASPARAGSTLLPM